MFSNGAAAQGQSPRTFDYRMADAAALAEGAPVCLDLTKVSGGTTYRGQTIGNDNAVNAFLAAPTAANLLAHAGFVLSDKAFNRGDHLEHLVCGAGEVRVRNTTAAEITLPVGTLLFAKPGVDYLVPGFINPTGGDTTKTVLPGGGYPKAMVTKATTIAATTTTKVPVHAFMPTAPIPRTFAQILPAAADLVDAIAFVAEGPGKILRAGLGALTCGTQGSITFNVKINGTSIFSATPVIDNDGTDGCHTLATVDTAVATYLGTGGAFGTIDPTKVDFDRGDIVSFDFTNTGTNDGTGFHAQIDSLLL